MTHVPASKFLNIAHRGASAVAPENTLSAFRAAIEAGATAIEMDLRVTRDGHVVIMHDRHVNRTTNGAGLVRQLTCRRQALSSWHWRCSVAQAYAGADVARFPGSPLRGATPKEVWFERTTVCDKTVAPCDAPDAEARCHRPLPKRPATRSPIVCRGTLPSQRRHLSPGGFNRVGPRRAGPVRCDKRSCGSRGSGVRPGGRALRRRPDRQGP
ncbi:MAG: hypothetical protein IID28_09845 [Planctomycetes bacterium]|nr:hypothetical protein [Planctomycetota bacterium]